MLVICVEINSAFMCHLDCYWWPKTIHNHLWHKLETGNGPRLGSLWDEGSILKHLPQSIIAYSLCSFLGIKIRLLPVLTYSSCESQQLGNIMYSSLHWLWNFYVIHWPKRKSKQTQWQTTSWLRILKIL